MCGREGLARSMCTRGGRRVCRKIQACTERVLNPPPPPPRTKGWTRVDLETLYTVPQRVMMGSPYSVVPDMSAVSDAVAKVSKQFAAFGEAFATFNQIDDEFKPIGYVSETGIEK